MRKYKESTPLEDRDEYKSWKKEADDAENLKAKDRFQNALRDRNQSIYDNWCNFLISLKDHAFPGRNSGFYEFLDGEDGEPYLLQTGYYDSFSFSTGEFYIHDNTTGGVGIGVWYKDGDEAGGDVFDEFIPQLKSSRGAIFYIIAAAALDEGSKVPDVSNSEKQQLNIFTKEAVASGHSRKEIAGLVQFLKEVIDGNADKYFPGAESIEYTGLECERPSVTVSYYVPVNPDIDDDETFNVIRGAQKLYEEFLPVMR